MAFYNNEYYDKITDGLYKMYDVKKKKNRNNCQNCLDKNCG